MKLSTLSIEYLGISEDVDESMPKTLDCKLKHSAIIKGLIINGLGFAERRRYIFFTYFEDLALEELFGLAMSYSSQDYQY